MQCNVLNIFTLIQLYKGFHTAVLVRHAVRSICIYTTVKEFLKCDSSVILRTEPQRSLYLYSRHYSQGREFSVIFFSQWHLLFAILSWTLEFLFCFGILWDNKKFFYFRKKITRCEKIQKLNIQVFFLYFFFYFLLFFFKSIYLFFCNFITTFVSIYKFKIDSQSNIFQYFFFKNEFVCSKQVFQLKHNDKV